MINFCVEPKQPCCKNPIGELDFKIDKCYLPIYSRLCKHVNDTVVHITQEERDEWNNKASKEALKDIQDQLNEITGDGSGSIKQEILLEVSKQITNAIAGLNLGDYAKKKYVDDAIKNINLDGYVTKTYADSTYLKIVDYTKFDADSYYTKAEIQNMLKNSNIGKDYSIESFAIENDKLILVQKNGGQFEVSLPRNGSDGGLDTDYVQQQLLNYIKKNTLSKLIINNKAYSIESGRDITIPTSGGGTSVDPTKFGYYKSYFKETSSKEQVPSKPSVNRPPEDGSGWVENAPNYRDGHYIWMTQVFINGNGQYGEYLNPICLTGSGTAGEDGSGVSFIYKTAIDGEEINSPGNVSIENGVPVVPSGWTDYPSGVTKSVPYEYCSIVTNIKGQWGSQWSQPFVWSHFGQNGMDGDGVEYIYYASTFAPSNNLPSTWTNDEGFQNREYIRENSGWTDDPKDLEKLGHGYKQYICVRKKYADTGSEDAYWHAYSDPALWGYYAKDGVVSGIIIDVAGEIKYLYVDNDYNNLEYSGESTITMYNDDSPVQFDLTIDSVKGSDGSYLSTQDIESYFSKTDNGDSKILKINIPANKLHFTDNTYYIVNVIGTPKSSSISSQKRVAQIQLYGIKRSGQLFTATDGTITLSENELVIFDDQKIVAGMTSSKAVDESSPLNGKVTTEGKGDVRIWAGEISNADLTTAPFTVTRTGNLTAHTATLYDATFYAENAQVKITNERFLINNSPLLKFENAGISISGNSEEYGDSKMFFGMQTSYPIDVSDLHYPKESTPVAFVLNENNKVRITPGRIDIDGENANLRVNGTTILKRCTHIDELGRIVRRDSFKSDLDDTCSVSINAGTHGGLGGDSVTITLPNSVLGRDVIIVNSKWNQLIVKVHDGCTLYKSGTSVNEVQMSKYTMAHAIQINKKDWIVGMMM